MKDRDKHIDCIRGIGIILVVLGHSGCSLTPYIYMFHMAIFFMISGYIYRDNKEGVLNYIKKKLKRLYIPYVIYGFVYILLHNLIFNIGLYTTDNRLMELNSTYHVYSLVGCYSIHDTIKQLLRTLLLGNNEQLLGVSWFVRILLIVYILHKLIRSFIPKAQYSIGFVFLLSSWILLLNGISLPLGLESVLSCYPAFLLGKCVDDFRINEKLHKNQIGMKLILLVCSLLIIFVCRWFGVISLGLNEIVNPVIFVACSMAGWFMLYIFVDLILSFHNKICLLFSKLMAYIGEKSFSIMWLHFTAFKIVTVLFVSIKGFPQYYIAAFPVLYVRWLWIAYSIIGIIVPIILSELFQITKTSFIKVSREKYE